VSAAEKSAAEKVAAAWGPSPPDWVAALAAECDRTSGGKVALLIDYSPAVISQVLAGKYRGSMPAVASKVRAALLAETVDCPALGVIDLACCLEWREKAKDYQPTSSLRGWMLDACNACPKNKD
jgi:hypothetical protein